MPSGKLFSGNCGSLDHENISFRDELDGHTDRGAAILAMADVDGFLTLMLRSYLIDDKRLNKLDRLDFEFRAMLAFGLQLISEQDFTDIIELAWIRNRFAHRIALPGKNGKMEYLTFANHVIAEKCQKLTIPERHPANDYEGIIAKIEELQSWDFEFPLLPPATDPRERYIRSCEFLSFAFHKGAVEVKPQVPKGSTITIDYPRGTLTPENQSDADQDQDGATVPQ